MHGDGYQVSHTARLPFVEISNGEGEETYKAHSDS